MISEVKNSKVLVALVLAVSSLSFTAAFAVVAIARTVQSRVPQSTDPATSVPSPPPVRLVFQDKVQSVQTKNALLIRQALAAQLTQARQSKSASIDRSIASGSNLPQSQLSSQNSPTHRSLVQNDVAYSPFVRAADVTTAAITIRVSIAQSSTISIGSSDEFSITSESGLVGQRFPGMQAFWVAAVGGGLQFGSVQSANPVWVRPATDDGLIFVGDRWYRGIVQIIPQGDSLMVVNYVDLEQYLYSVVGSEMPSSWNPEALKAQSIAARSYALVHMSRPDSQWFDLTNTQRHQVYAGVGSETAESASAVLETAGLVVAASDGEIFEAMYASTDRVVATAHRGFTSMSQTGAAVKAEAGWNFAEILAFYYPDTALASF